MKRRDDSSKANLQSEVREAPDVRPLSGLPAEGRHQRRSVRSLLGIGTLTALLMVFWKALSSLVVLASGSEIHSHILLVPFISAYLVLIRRKHLPTELRPSPAWAIVPLLVGLAALAAVWDDGVLKAHFSDNEWLSIMMLSFFCFLVAWGFLFLGRKWMVACAFPVAFLVLVVPLPDGVVDRLETASMLASAEAADVLFRLSGTPVLRDGTIFQLPGMIVEVAQECSGIRSSLVLFITALLAANLLLRSPWRQALLIAAVIPLGIIRNGIRILVISLLCVHVGPHMIHSDIHRRGGPVFFAFSLIPLFILLWWLRRGEVSRADSGGADGVARHEGGHQGRKVFRA